MMKKFEKDIPLCYQRPIEWYRRCIFCVYRLYCRSPEEDVERDSDTCRHIVSYKIKGLPCECPVIPEKKEIGPIAKKVEPKYVLVSISNPLEGNLSTERGLLCSAEPGNIYAMEKFISLLKIIDEHDIKYSDIGIEPVGILFKTKKEGDI